MSFFDFIRPIKMSSTVIRKTGSVTLVIENFSQQTECKDIDLKIEDFSNNYFGIKPSAVIFEDAYVFVYFLNFDNLYKFRANVSILGLEGEKLFTKECFEEFADETYEIHCSLMQRSKLLSPENGYLDNDKLTLLCEIEMIEVGHEKIDDTIQIDLNNLSEEFGSLLIDGKFTDATLVVGIKGKEFNVHKAILAARSSVFAAMFEHDCEEKRQNKVNITDMDEEVCEEMMSYIYTGKVKELDRFAMELLVAADKYQLNSLKSICTQYMCNHLTVSSVANVLILADLHQATDLKTKCIEFISANVGQVQVTDGWKVLGKNGTLLQEIIISLADKNK